MTDFIQITKTLNWLEAKFRNGENGIIFDCHSHSSFDVIQDFIEDRDQPFQTPVIYYEAFPGESKFQFIDTLGEELAAKLGKSRKNNYKSLLNIIEEAGLKMIAIDRCHFCPQETLEQLLDLFTNCQIAIILVGDRQKMTTSKLLKHPLVSQWDKFEEESCIGQV